VVVPLRPLGLRSSTARKAITGVVAKCKPGLPVPWHFTQGLKAM
jgi:hypothetical protein